MKKYVDISGFNINQANRGNAALSYGAINFLMQKGLLHSGQELVFYKPFRNFFRFNLYRSTVETYRIEGVEWKLNKVALNPFERVLLHLGIVLPFTKFGKFINNTEYEAADYGGDGFSDIYGDEAFLVRMNQTFILQKKNIPLIMLPMTIGPFKKTSNKALAHKIMRYASKVYVRDMNYIEELKKLKISYEVCKDLSAYMHPEPWNIEIKENAIGVNVSGLAYSNGFGNLVGQFDVYPVLIDKIINHFRNKGMYVYLIPHSYDCECPADHDDDMVVCREAYCRLQNKERVIFVDNDLTSPQVKYVISKMKFFVGTRMHANFAAIYTNVPVFGLAYSYKFKGGFNANGLDADLQTEMINNISLSDIDNVVKKIDFFYKTLGKNEEKNNRNTPSSVPSVQGK